MAATQKLYVFAIYIRNEVHSYFIPCKPRTFDNNYNSTHGISIRIAFPFYYPANIRGNVTTLQNIRVKNLEKNLKRVSFFL